MTNITVTIDRKSNAMLFLKMLKSLRFVKKVTTEKVEKNTLSKEDIKILEARWRSYLKNPESAQSWPEVKSFLVKKYAR